MFKNLLSKILLGLALSTCLFFGVVPPSIAEVPLNVESGVDRFLTSIPSGYYTIANVEGLKNLLKNSQTLLVDVREPSEYQSGHIPNAINIPLRTLSHNLEQIPRDAYGGLRLRPVVLYCSSGY